MPRRDDAGEFLEGDGAEDTILDDGDNTGDAGHRYRGCRQFGTTASEAARGQSLEQRLSEEEPDLLGDGTGQLGWSDDRLQRRELAGAVTGGDGSHSRTDPDLLGPDPPGKGLSAEEAALHPIRLRDASRTAPTDPATRSLPAGPAGAAITMPPRHGPSSDSGTSLPSG
jgi:hypothetical protein